MENFAVNYPQLRIAILVTFMSLLWLAEYGWPLSARRKNSVIPNIALTIISLTIYSLLGLTLVPITEWTHANGFGVLNWLETNRWVEMIIGVMALDLWAAYFVHSLFHRFSLLWSFHRIHHLDPMVDVTTAFRQHPFETFMRFFFMFTGVFLLGLPLWMVLIYQTLSSINALLEHSNIRLANRVEQIAGIIFVTPGLHKIHHSSSQEETDSNYSNIFSIWDRLFRTLNTKRVNQVIQYGLNEPPDTHRDSTVDLLVKPLKKAGNP